MASREVFPPVPRPAIVWVGVKDRHLKRDALPVETRRKLLMVERGIAMRIANGTYTTYHLERISIGSKKVGWGVVMARYTTDETRVRVPDVSRLRFDIGEAEEALNAIGITGHRIHAHFDE